MRVFLVAALVLAAILIVSSINFGFDLKTAIYTFLYLCAFSLVTYFSYQHYAGILIPKIWFYLIAGIFFSFCFYPLLEFYSLKTTSYSILDWFGVNEGSFRLGFVEQKWYGKWYGKLIFTLFCSLIAIIIQQIFDNQE